MAIENSFVKLSGGGVSKVELSPTLSLNPATELPEVECPLEALTRKVIEVHNDQSLVSSIRKIVNANRLLSN
jgi:hypothetical protein